MKQKLQNLTQQQKAYLYYAALFCVVWVLYGNTLSHSYNLDDSYYINLLPAVGEGFGRTFFVFTEWFGKSNYRPLPTFHLSVEQYFFGRSPFVFHFFNLVYYSILGILLFKIFNRFKLFDKQWAVFLMVLFFLIHPSHSNVVASIKNRDVILGMLYGILFVWAILQYHEKRKIFYIPLSILFVLASIACKLDGLMFVPLAGVLFYFLKEQTIKTWFFPLLVLQLLVFGLFSLITNYLISPPEFIESTSLWENPLIQVSFSKGFVLNTSLAFNYHKFMIIPKDYLFYYGFNQIKVPSILSFQVLGAFIFHLVLFITALYHIYKGKRNKIMMGVIIYFLFLLPYTIYLNSVAGIIAVRYSFNASLGFAILVIAVYYTLYQNSKYIYRSFLLILLSGVFMIFTYATFQRNKDWKDKETLFTKDIEKLSDSYMANAMVGIYYYNLTKNHIVDKNQIKEYRRKSERYLNAAKRIMPKDPLLWIKLGELNISEGNYKEAYNNFKEAIAVDSNNVASWEAYGEFCLLAKDYERSEVAFTRVIQLDNDNVIAYRNLLNALVKQGKSEYAIGVALSMKQSPFIEMKAHEFLGNIYWELGDTINSVESFKMSIEKGNTSAEVIDFVEYYINSNN